MRVHAVLALALAVVGANPLEAQVPDTTTYAAVAVSTHPRSTVVSVVTRIPQGSSADPEGLEGSAWMLGELLAHQATEAVGPDASVTVHVHREETWFTLLAVPTGWEEAWQRLEDVLFRGPLTDADVEEHRQDVLDALVFDAGSPVRSFQQESARLLSSPSAPWARSIEGTPESVARIAPADLRSLKSRGYDAGTSIVSVVGPQAYLPNGGGPSYHVRSGMRQVPIEARTAWQAGDRKIITQDVTNTWLTVAWPVAPGVDRTSLEFLAHLLEADLDPVPPDPDRFDVDVRLLDTPDGDVLLVEAAVFPEAADRWEARILGSLDDLLRRPLDENFLGWRRRRFRTVRLLAEAAPEQEAVRLASDLARSGDVRELGIQIWQLDGAKLLEAARALGEPRILRLGPDLAQEGTRN